MKKTFLDFEKDIEALDEKIDELRSMQESDPSMDIGEEVDRLEQKSAELLKQTYAELTPWQISQVARHPNRPCPSYTSPSPRDRTRPRMPSSA